MNTKSLKQKTLTLPNNNLTTSEETDGFLSQLLSGIKNGITTSPGQKVVINITINLAQGGGAQVINGKPT